MTSAKIEFLLSALSYLKKDRARIALTAYPESLYSKMINVNRGGLSVE